MWLCLFLARAVVVIISAAPMTGKHALPDIVLLPCFHVGYSVVSKCTVPCSAYEFISLDACCCSCRSCVMVCGYLHLRGCAPTAGGKLRRVAPSSAARTLVHDIMADSKQHIHVSPCQAISLPTSIPNSRVNMHISSLLTIVHAHLLSNKVRSAAALFLALTACIFEAGAPMTEASSRTCWGWRSVNVPCLGWVLLFVRLYKKELVSTCIRDP